MILAGISLALAVMSAVALLRLNPELESYDATAYDCDRAALGVRRVADSPAERAWFGYVPASVDAGWSVVEALTGLRGALTPCVPIQPLRHERVAA
jgi:hypothetical protein